MKDVKMKILKIAPCDNTFFREGNDFNMGRNNFIRSKNTPYPSTFFGAIYTAFLSHNDNFREKFFKMSKYDHHSILKIGQVYLYNEISQKVYVPAPKDLFVKTNKEKKLGTFVKLNKALNSISYDYFLESPPERDYIRADQYYMNIDGFYEGYLQGRLREVELKATEEIFEKNIKTGIGMNTKTRTVETSKLYTIEQTEFRNNNKNKWCYLVEYGINQEYIQREYGVFQINELQKGYLKLGGENKVCTFNQINNSKVHQFKKNQQTKIEDIFIKIIFTSEAFFKKSIDEIFTGDIKLLGVVNDKPIYIGGYDMRLGGKGQAKRMYKGYPAGSIFLVKKLEKELDINTYLEKYMDGQQFRGFNQYLIQRGECIDGKI